MVQSTLFKGSLRDFFKKPFLVGKDFASGFINVKTVVTAYVHVLHVYMFFSDFSRYFRQSHFLTLKKHTFWCMLDNLLEGKVEFWLCIMSVKWQDVNEVMVLQGKKALRYSRILHVITRPTDEQPNDSSLIVIPHQI